MRIAINNGLVLAMTEPEVKSAHLLIEDGVIIAVSDYAHAKADKTIDAGGHLVMPGLINAHTHIAMSLLRNYADDLPFWPWLTDKIWPAEAKLTSEGVYWGSMLSIAEMIASGTTTFNDMYFFTEETIKAIQATGIRANLCRGLTSGDEEIKKLEEGLALFETYHESLDGRLRIDLGPHAPYTCEPGYLARIGEDARRIGARIHIHLSESEKEVSDSFDQHGKSPIDHVASLGLMEGPLVAAHCVHLDDRDIAIMAEKGIHMVNNPSSNLKLANGFAPLHKVMAAGINVALGTDGPSSNNNQDMFEEMHLAAILNKSVSGDTTFLPAFEVLKMATVNGAKALGIDHLVGTLEPGKRADLIMVDLEKPHMKPMHNPLSALVYSAAAADVDFVMVDGKILYEDGELTTLDVTEVYREAERHAGMMTGRNATQEQ